MTEKKFSLTAANLKWIAITLMLLNHFCSCLQDFFGIDNFFVTDFHWYISRAAFVIFAYQIAEGMHYSKNRQKYLISLFVFAIASEIPYDLCFYLEPFYMANQNVFFNLALGALAIDIIDRLGQKPWHIVLVTTLTMVIAVLIKADYSTMAEILIVAFYYLRDNKKKQLIVSAIIFIITSYSDYMILYAPLFNYDLVQLLAYDKLWINGLIEMCGLLAWPLLMLYKGEKGKNINKWFFYFFYPAHLIILHIFTLLFANI